MWSRRWGREEDPDIVQFVEAQAAQEAARATDEYTAVDMKLDGEVGTDVVGPPVGVSVTKTAVGGAAEACAVWDTVPGMFRQG